MPENPLPEQHAALWRSATEQPFLDAVRDGTLSTAAFDTWLAQDARFVADLLRFQARLLARAPREAQAVLAGGCVALVEELGWFEQLADRRGLDLAAAPLAATREYADLLDRLDSTSFAEAVRCLWVLERVYLDAWASAAPAAGEFAELVEHWTTPGFRSYVDALEELAADGGEAEQLVAAVLRQETAFWDMALPAADAP